MTRQQRRLTVLFLLATVASATACADSLTAPSGMAAPPAVRASEALTTPAGYIRIGVVQSSDTSILIGGTGAFSVRDKATGAVLATGANTQVRVSLVPGDAATYYRLQVSCTRDVAQRDALLAAAAAKGYLTFTQWNAAPAALCWRVLLGQFALTGTYGVRVTYRTKAIADGVAAADSWWPTITTGSGSQLRLVSGGTTLQTATPVVVTPLDGVLLIAGIRYRGTGEIVFNSATKLAGVNELPLQEYLYGVVPKELSPGLYPEVEAIKAQAIAARTYALAGMGKRWSDGYDLLATTSDQVYGGLSAEQAMSNQAVDETAGMVITYEGKLISALYSSTSGGWTADNDEAYAASPVAYLRGIPDAQRGEALEHVPDVDVFRNHASAKSLRAAHQRDFESDWARFHRWSYDWTAAEMRDVLSRYFGQDVGTVREINVLERGGSGRVLLIEFVAENGTFTARKDGIRSVLQFYDAANVRTNLPSTLFFIEPIVDHKTKAIEGFQAWGGGFGHGVGMAQTGAVGMAQKGASYEEILTHYYRGVTIETR